MAKLYGKVGSLTHLLNILGANGIYDFKTMNDIRSFRNNYTNSLKEIKKRYKDILQKEIINLESAHEKLETEISSLKSNYKNCVVKWVKKEIKRDLPHQSSIFLKR